MQFQGMRPFKQPTAIVPCTQFDMETLERIRRGLPLRVEITYDRSSPENRWWHALVGVVADGLGKPPEILKLELKHECQLWWNVYASPIFGKCYEYKSVAFGAMSGPDFTDFRIKSVDVIFTKYLDRITRNDVYNRVEELTGETWRPP